MVFSFLGHRGGLKGKTAPSHDKAKPLPKKCAYNLLNIFNFYKSTQKKLHDLKFLHPSNQEKFPWTVQIFPLR